MVVGVLSKSVVKNITNHWTAKARMRLSDKKSGRRGDWRILRPFIAQIVAAEAALSGYYSALRQ
jgi:hypothetical protein